MCFSYVYMDVVIIDSEPGTSHSYCSLYNCIPGATVCDVEICCYSLDVVAIWVSSYFLILFWASYARYYTDRESNYIADSLEILHEPYFYVIFATPTLTTELLSAEVWGDSVFFFHIPPCFFCPGTVCTC